MEKRWKGRVIKERIKRSDINIRIGKKYELDEKEEGKRIRKLKDKIINGRIEELID